MDYETIAAYLSGECDPAEKQSIEQWRKANTENERSFLRWQLLWQASQGVEEDFVPDATTAWQKVNPAIGTNIRTKTLPTPQTPSHNQVFIWFRNMAAMLLLVGGLGWAVWQLNPKPDSQAAAWVEKSAAIAGTDAIVLRDGTRIWLNEESKVRYPEQFDSQSRDIYLEGEAYFEVAHQARKPFLVHTTQSVTHVLGTTFSVRSYTHEPTIEVNLLSGKVSFSLADTLPDQKKTVKARTKSHSVQR
jgi:ferric-dicitrate binding protein FerR (iron transport regulator)